MTKFMVDTSKFCLSFACPNCEKIQYVFIDDIKMREVNTRSGSYDEMHYVKGCSYCETTIDIALDFRNLDREY